MTVKELMKIVDPIHIIARAVWNDHERDSIGWILHYYGLYYNIINQPECESNFIILYKAIDKNNPFADVFMRDLEEYKSRKEIINYSCSFLEASLYCNAKVPKKLIEHHGKSFIASEILREYGWTCWERDDRNCPQRHLETILKMLGDPRMYGIVNKYDISKNLSNSELDDCVMEFIDTMNFCENDGT